MRVAVFGRVYADKEIESWNTVYHYWFMNACPFLVNGSEPAAKLAVYKG